ncbi:MAG: MinD/ParA family protein [Gracilibacteraceae bacterium]|jgi:flagellar biosynthesis protein FlhG|nr:MinD/ParA family protein [Gracilibacteraceae bacterium]
MPENQLKLGQTLIFTTDADLYRDIYKARIVGVFSDRIDLDIPLHKGYLLLIPIGTTLRVLQADSNRVLTAQVVARRTVEKIWSISVPHLERHERRSRTIAIGSGKGGVGKTTLSINLSLALCRLGKRVLIFDADIGMANVEVLLKLNNPRNLTNVLNGECGLRDVVTTAPGGLKIIPGSSGISALTSLDALQFNRILSGFTEMEPEFDIFIIDTSAGISDLVLKFLEAADQQILITTPEPHAMVDTFAVAKALAGRSGRFTPFLVFNRCESEAEANRCLELFHRASAQFLRLKPEMIGWIYDDKKVLRSLKEQVPLILSDPDGMYAQQVLAIAGRLTGQPPAAPKTSGIASFFRRMQRGFR